ncbi:TPA: hypothetical protein QDC20_003920 [Burkholderia aenigmatica]|nr:hypothetical protein [Burkholderia sp. AU45251]HDR9514332.1 hypothetical protein [Burkholderia aenigmatica]MDN7516594.1 hypothetical protein [Burkholderia sp. AU45251]HDR9591722.1 hypothetical protein [Burkholderia aenigmatica]HDR9600962.1 hypothetical protein [Burkholderia aenigmatica]HDR9607571.1 hypothetical protein [Burkholderia aenigmatica]
MTLLVAGATAPVPAAASSSTLRFALPNEAGRKKWKPTFRKIEKRRHR